MPVQNTAQRRLDVGPVTGPGFHQAEIYQTFQGFTQRAAAYLKHLCEFWFRRKPVSRLQIAAAHELLDPAPHQVHYRLALDRLKLSGSNRNAPVGRHFLFILKYVLTTLTKKLVPSSKPQWPRRILTRRQNHYICSNVLQTSATKILDNKVRNAP